MYTISPMEHLAALNPNCIINIAASPFSYSKTKIKTDIFQSHAKKWNLPLFYINQVGAHTDLIFDGGSMIINAQGDIVDSLALFEEDFKIYDLDFIRNSKLLTQKQSIDKPEIEKIHDALVLGIRDYFQKSGLKTATLGLSGGIDSAVTLVLAVRALGSESVRVLLMPSQFSSDHSIADAVKLADSLNVKYDIVPIQPMFEQFVYALKPVFGNLPYNITEENIQARVRGLLLMAISNKFGNIVLNTSNKSEIAVGYGTLYGDMNGAISVLGDVYKTDVYKLAQFMNQSSEIIPNNSIIKPPSAELRFDQKDSDSLPEYDLLDAILFQYIEQQLSVNEIIASGKPREITERVIKLVNFNEYKRFQTPPILRISSKAFGQGRKMPIVAKY
jgi:NAD+ synthase (glutamine-hydrolysing)